MSILERMVERQNVSMRTMLPVKPSMTELQNAIDLILGESLITLNQIINDDTTDEETSRGQLIDSKIKAINSATNIARYFEVRKAQERDSQNVKVEFDDADLVLGVGDG